MSNRRLALFALAVLLSGYVIFAAGLWLVTTDVQAHGDTTQHGLYFFGVDDETDDDYVKVPNDPSWEVNDFTISFWINRNDSTGTLEHILDGRDSGWRNGVWFEISTTDKISCGVAGAASDDKVIALTSIPDDGTWSNVACTYTSGTRIELFINGTYDNGKDTAVVLTYTTADLYIGQMSPVLPNDRPFNGTLDEFRMYDRNVTDADILSDYSGEETPTNSTGLVVWYHLNEGEGQTANDLSPEGNDGQLGSTGGADANDPTWVTPITDDEWWFDWYICIICVRIDQPTRAVIFPESAFTLEIVTPDLVENLTWYNIQQSGLAGDPWLWDSNQTYEGVTALPGLETGNFTIHAWANDTDNMVYSDTHLLLSEQVLLSWVFVLVIVVVILVVGEVMHGAVQFILGLVVILIGVFTMSDLGNLWVTLIFFLLGVVSMIRALLAGGRYGIDFESWFG